jgi:hypothetical protein
MSSQIVWTVSHGASDDVSRGVLGVFSTMEAAAEVADAETKEWPFVGIEGVVWACDEGGPLDGLQGMEFKTKTGTVTQTMTVRPRALEP